MLDSLLDTGEDETHQHDCSRGQYSKGRHPGLESTQNAERQNKSQREHGCCPTEETGPSLDPTHEEESYGSHTVEDSDYSSHRHGAATCQYP